MKTTEELRNFYETELIPWMTLLDKDRKKKLTGMFVISLFSVLIISVVSFLVLPFFFKTDSLSTTEYPTSNTYSTFLLLSTAACFFLFALYKASYLYEYRSRFKFLVLEKLVTFLDETFIYSPKGTLPQNRLHMSNFFNISDFSPQRWKVENQVKGIIGKTPFEMCEIRPPSPGKEKQPKSGLFFTADFNKHFCSRITLYPKHLPSIVDIFNSIMRPKPILNIDHPKFDRFYLVHSEDSITTHYILTPNLMDRILSLTEKVKRPVVFSFWASKLFIYIPFGHSLLEPKLFSSMLKFETIEEYYNILKLSIDIVEGLNLNTRIWTKE